MEQYISYVQNKVNLPLSMIQEMVETSRKDLLFLPFPVKDEVEYNKWFLYSLDQKIDLLSFMNRSNERKAAERKITRSFIKTIRNRKER